MAKDVGLIGLSLPRDEFAKKRSVSSVYYMGGFGSEWAHFLKTGLILGLLVG